MLSRIWNFFKPPLFAGDEDKTRRARYAHIIASGLLVAASIYAVLVRASIGLGKPSIFELILIGFAIACLMGLWLIKQGYVRLISFLLIALIWLTSNGFAATGYGARDASFIINFAIVLMAGLLLGWKASWIITVCSILSGIALAFAEQNGLIAVVSYPVLLFARDVTFVYALNGILIFLLINGLETALRNSRSHLAQLESANRNLNSTQIELQNRSTDLLTVNSQLENRTKKLHAVAEITRTATTLRDFDQLLPLIPGIIGSYLEYYHVAIFMLDEQKQYAILRSANTDAGLKLIARGYRLPVGQLGIVSAVAQSGQPRIAVDLKQIQPLPSEAGLPETRSELALPLKAGDEIIGVLDIHSRKPNDFSEDDISTLSILADQVGIALQNALLFGESQRALREANIESLQTSRHAWQAYAQALQTKGYRYDGIKSEPLQKAKRPPNENEALLIPVQLRGQTIGRLKLNPSERSHAWTDDELLMVRATAERVALALEGARLLDEAQKRATREAFLSEVAAKLATSFQLDSILRDTVQELGQTLKNSTVTFQLVRPSEASVLPGERSNGSTAHKPEPGADND